MLWSDIVQTDNIATTLGAAEAIGTIQLNKDARRFIGFSHQFCNSRVVTAAEANTIGINVESADLGISEWRGLAPISEGGAPATNIANVASKLKTVPVGMKVNGNDRITFSAELLGSESTADFAGQVTVWYDDGSTPDGIIKMMMEAPYGIEPNLQHELRGVDADIGDATQEAFADNPRRAPSRFSKVVNFNGVVSPDSAPTAAEFFLGFVEITSTISGITPLRIPLPAIGSSLGTPVGSPIVPKNVNWPLWIPKGNNNEDFSATANILNVTSGAHHVAYSLGLQK